MPLHERGSCAKGDVLVISDVRLSKGSTSDVLAGLIGWVKFRINDRVLIDGVTLRRTAAGRLTLSFPARRDRQGGQHPFIRPSDQSARNEIEEQVFAALGLDRGGAA